MENTFGYNPKKLAGEIYYASVIEQMSRYGFNLVGRTMVDSNDADYHVNWYAYNRRTQLMFRHRDVALVVLMAHCEDAGTNEHNGKVNVEHYGSYWDLDVIAEWDTPYDMSGIWVDTLQKLFHLQDHPAYSNCGGSSSSEQSSFDFNVHSTDESGKLLFDRQVDARTLCLPLLQFLVNTKMKIKRGTLSSIWWYQLCPDFSYPAVELTFTNRIKADGTLARILNNFGKIKAMPAELMA